jgi:hypothetical protein
MSLLWALWMKGAHEPSQAGMERFRVDNVTTSDDALILYHEQILILASFCSRASIEPLPVGNMQRSRLVSIHKAKSQEHAPGTEAFV